MVRTFLGLFPPSRSSAVCSRTASERCCRRLGADFPGDERRLLSRRAQSPAAYFGRKVGDPRAWSWFVLIFCSMLMGTAWGVITGAAGGAVGFGFGAIPGVICAVPVALAAFPVFATLHRAVSRDGMIEERQLWPLAFGIPVIIAALILSPGIYSY